MLSGVMCPHVIILAGVIISCCHVSRFHHGPHLAGHVAVAGHVAHPDVLDVGVNLLLQGGEGRDIEVPDVIDHHHLKTTLQ